MSRYTRKAQVLFTEEQYQGLLDIAEERQTSVGALLRNAADQLYLRKRRSEAKRQAIQALLSLPETEVPADYQTWEQEYLDERAGE